MNKVFVKKENESYVLVDKETGEIKKLIETFVVDEEKWVKLYANLFCLACDELSGQAIKLFIVIMKYAVYDEGRGNLFYTNNPYYKEEIKQKNLKANITRSLKELIDNGLLHRISNGLYRLNPQVAYYGTRKSRAELLLNIKTENENI